MPPASLGCKRKWLLLRTPELLLPEHTDHGLLRCRDLKPVPHVLAMPGLALAGRWRGRVSVSSVLTELQVDFRTWSSQLQTPVCSAPRQRPTQSWLLPLILRTVLMHSTVLGKSFSTMTKALDLAHPARGSSCCGQRHHTNLPLNSSEDANSVSHAFAPECRVAESVTPSCHNIFRQPADLACSREEGAEPQRCHVDVTLEAPG